MKKKMTVVVLVAAVFLLTSATAARAEWGDGWRRGGRRNVDKREMKERIHLIKMWKLTEVLDLDQVTAAKLFPIMNDFDVKRDALREKRGDTMKAIRDELDKDAPDATTLGSLIDRFKKDERAMVELRIERLDALSEVLTDEQIAELIALVPKFERGMRGMIGRAHAMRKERRRWFKRQEDSPQDFERGRRFE